MGLLRRRDGLDLRSFREHWSVRHAALACEALPLLKGYIQNVVVEAAQRSIDFPRLPIDVDGISQLYFDDLTSADIKREDDQLRQLVEDERHFVQGLDVVTALQNVVIPPVNLPSTAVKRMAFLRKHPHVTSTEFRKQWFDLHATLVSRIPGVIGYRQNLVLDQRGVGGRGAGIEPAVNMDGIVELWFAGLPEIEAGFRSQQGVTVMTHALEFIFQISTYLVDPVVIVPEPAEALL